MLGTAAATISVYEQVFESQEPRPNPDDEPLVIDALHPDRNYSFATLRSHVRSVAMSFRDEYGLQVGDVVGIYGPNDIDFFVAMHGSVAAGCATLVLPICSTMHELAETFKLAEPRALVTHPATVEIVLGALEEYGQKIPVFIMTAAAAAAAASPAAALSIDQSIYQRYPGTTPLQDLFWHPERLTGSLPTVKGEDIAYFYTTSGSTGPRKLVITDHNASVERLVANIRHFPPAVANDREMAVSHFGHGMAGTFMLQAAVMKGARQYVVETTDVDLIFLLVEKHCITKIAISPWLACYAANHPEHLGKYNLTSLQTVITGGQVIPFKTCQRAKENMGLSVFCYTYGSTEALFPLCPVFSTDNIEYSGKRYTEEGYYAKLVNESGQEVPLGEPGELWIKTPALTSGYYRDPVKTAEVFDKDGYYHTGDILSEDSEGRFYFVGRKSDFIRTCFKTVSSKPIEEICMSFDGVHECAVVGALSSSHGFEFPRAYIVIATTQLALFESMDAFLQYVDEHVPEECMRLQGGVRVLQELPRISMGKVDKHRLRVMAQQEIQEILTHNS